MSQLEFSQLLGNYGEFVGAIAIVVTLVYLSVQIRQNTLMTRASIRQARSDSSVQLYSLGATSEIAEIRLKESLDEPLTELEEQRMFMWSICLWRQQQTIFFQNQDQLLDEQTGAEQAAIARKVMESPSARKFWASNKMNTFDSRFVSWIDDATEPE